MAASVVSETTIHYDGWAFHAHRSRQARTIQTTTTVMFALPGALTPIHRDRLEAHQADGLSMHEIVEYENKRFLETNIRVREKHAQWVRRDYDAMVKVERKLQAEKMAKEAQAAAEYQRRLAEMLAGKDD